MFLSTAVAGVLVSTVAGCGTTTLDAAKAEEKITEAVTSQVGAKLKTVTCPEDREAKKGDTFPCAVLGQDGSRGDAIVTQKDEEGNVGIRAPFLHVREIERNIGTGLAKQLGGDVVKLTCPEIIVVKAGGTFDCRATQGTSKGTVNVTQKDAKGNVTYKLANGSGG
jgi:hypothetical protein